MLKLGLMVRELVRTSWDGYDRRRHRISRNDSIRSDADSQNRSIRQASSAFNQRTKKIS
jgi:hypothetical protein